MHASESFIISYFIRLKFSKWKLSVVQKRPFFDIVTMVSFDCSFEKLVAPKTHIRLKKVFEYWNFDVWNEQFWNGEFLNVEVRISEALFAVCCILL